MRPTILYKLRSVQTNRQVNLISHCIFKCQVPQGVGWIPPPPIWKTPKGLSNLKKNPEVIYNFRSHAKVDRQKFKIEEIEEL